MSDSPNCKMTRMKERSRSRSKSSDKSAERTLRSEISRKCPISTGNVQDQEIPSSSSPRQASSPPEYATDMNFNLLNKKKSRAFSPTTTLDNNNGPTGLHEPQISDPLSSKANKRPSKSSMRPPISSSRDDLVLPQRTRSRHSKTNLTVTSKSNVDPLLPEAAITGTGNDDSVRSSLEGTPVILSREGSRIRIVDEETGEIFFRKRSKSRSREGRRKQPIFMPRLSSTRLCKNENSSVNMDSNSVEMKSTKNSLSSSPRPRRGISKTTMDQVAGDRLICNNATISAPLASRRGVNKSLNPFEDSDNDSYEDDDDDADEITLCKSVSRSGRSTTSLASKTVRGILKNTARLDGEENDDRATRNTKCRNSSKSPTKKQSSRSPSRVNLVPPPQLNNNNTSEGPPPGKTRSSKFPGEFDLTEAQTPRKTAKKIPKVSTTRGSLRMPRPSDTSVVPTIKTLPNKILRLVFGYMNREDLEACGRVCYQWKCLTDLQLRGPFVFQGKSVYGHYYSPHKCRDFVNFLLDLEPQFYHPVEMRIHSMSDKQASTVASDKLEINFKQAVKHMESVTLRNCCLKWKTLMGLLRCFSRHLRNLTDIGSVHFSQPGPCLCGNYRQQLKKEVDRKEFKDFKDNLKGLRRLVISRKTVTPELPVYLCIMTQGTRYLDELEVNLGPYETPNPSNDTEFSNLLSIFVKELRALLYKNKETLKILRFSWSDKNFMGYFSTCLDALEKIKLNQLHTVYLQFDKHALRGKGVSALRDFLEYHYSQRLRFFTLDRITLTENWATTAEFLDELVEIIPPSFAGMDFKVVVSDRQGPIKMAPVHQILRLEVFRRFISDMHFCIENENTKSISQMFGREWHRKNYDYPRVKSVVVTFVPRPQQQYAHFNNYNIDLISTLFPNLTELRISDRLVEHNQIFTPVIGRKLVCGVSNAQLENKDIQLIARNLVNLRILRMWVNMGTVDDHGMTGIHRGDISILHEDDEHFSWTNFHHEVLPSFSHMQFLEELSLRGLGSAVTDITLKFGFKSLDRLKLLELYGKLGVTKKGKREFRRNIKSNESGTVVRIKYRAT